VGEHPYRPIPTPPRMRWAVVPGHRWSYAYLAWAAVGAASCVAVGIVGGAPLWWYPAVAALHLPLVRHARMRFLRVPVEPPRVRVAVTDTLEEHRDLVDAGYVYDHEAQVYRLRDEWDLDTQRRIDALMRAGLVEVETVEMPSARKGKP